MAEALLVVLLSVAASTVLARRFGVPEPLAFLLAGMALAFVPDLSEVRYDADVVFLVFFPILLFAAAFEAPWNDLRPNLVVSARRAIGTVIATTLAVGAAAHALVPGLDWAPALLLGAILADPDFHVFFALAQRMRVPRQLRVTLTGEGLLEGTAQLVLYLALSAAITAGTWSLSHLVQQLVAGPVIGAVVGLAAANVLATADRRVPDPAVSVLLLLAAPFAAYFPAEALGGNRITAVVACGLSLGRHHDLVPSLRTRLATPTVWGVLVLAVSGFIYVPAGSALPEALGRIDDSAPAFAVQVVVLTAVTIACRVAWILGIDGALEAARRRRRSVARLAAGSLLLSSLAATRGAFALASALALPLATSTGTPFPDRDVLVALALAVVLASVGTQTVALRALLGRIRVPPDFRNEDEEALAWRTAADAALERLVELVAEGHAPDGLAADLRHEYARRRNRYKAAHGGRVAPPPERELRRELMASERAALLRLRTEDRISDTVYRVVQRDLDLLDEYLRLTA